MKKKSILKYTIFNELRKMLLLNRFRRKWVKRNPNNDTVPNNIFDENTVRIGDYTYGQLNVVSFDNKSKLIIGKYVSIAQSVNFLLDVEHHTDYLMTYPFKSKILLEKEPESFSKGNIIIDDDVWIGYGATIMSGVHIGQGAVIAAGAIVTKDVPPYAIVGGVPAHIIKFRFSDEIVSNIKKININEIDKRFIEENLTLLYKKLELEILKKIFDD